MASSKKAPSAKPKASTRRSTAPGSPLVRHEPGQRKTGAAPAAVDSEDSGEDVWTMRLYVAGDSPKSRAALSNLQRLCDTHLKGKHRIEVIDLKTRPELAKADQILALPTLVRKIPEPMKRLIGDLSDADRAMVALELAGLGGSGGKRPQHPD